MTMYSTCLQQTYLGTYTYIYMMWEPICLDTQVELRMPIKTV